MNIHDYYLAPDEKPLDRLVTDGGMTGIFRTIACVGDSLSSGEFEDVNADGVKTYHDMFDHSWGQHLGRMAGSKVYNFSRGGMSAQQYCETFAEEKGFWDPDKACQAYVIALGVNEFLYDNASAGSVTDIDLEDYTKNKATFMGYYGQIIQRYKEIQPDAKFFLMTMPYETADETGAKCAITDKQAELFYALSSLFSNCYVLDLRKYAPDYSQEFRDTFFLGGHMSAMGYIYTARMVTAYIDYIIRHNFEDFRQVSFIGTPYRNTTYDSEETK
jgi:hypothetical protein